MRFSRGIGINILVARRVGPSRTVMTRIEWCRAISVVTVTHFD